MSFQEQSNATLLNTPGVLGVYNFTQGDCSSFRRNATTLFFKVWPENSFRYCCEDTTSVESLGNSLGNYTYGNHSARLISRPYFDLGIIDSLSPYFQQYRFWQVPQTQIVLDGIKCEYTDLKSLYSHRFWRNVMADGLQTAAYVIAIIQVVVVVFVLFKWGILACLRKKPQIRENMKRWWWTKIKLEDWVSDLAHITLVVLVGHGLIEAVGHSSPVRWRPIVFYNAAVVYTWLTLLCLITSVLRQLAVSAFDESEDEVKRREYHQVRLEKEYLSKEMPVPKEEMDSIQTTGFAFARISEDWRWQRVFGQLSVIILVGTYLMFVDDDSGSAMDNIAAILLAALVVACMWSGGVGLVLAGRTLSHIARHLMTQRLPTVHPEEMEILKQIQIEGSRNQISQTFYGPGASHRYRHNYNQHQFMSGQSHIQNGNGVSKFEAGPHGSVYR